ncbi:acyltransferase family protein [Smaragdicoccus niigatensis]|uniref:acyltransferase family protein n=1 Tax=Smaragdicoccus niigatensis TaxID=359359 RepID=UPI0003825A65|nr:acyltransferase [Smaragdicoccus niigatensis]
MEAPAPDKHANLALDVVRGVAALLVLLAHARRTVVQMSGVQTPTGGLELLSMIPTSFAREAVAVFFVLSGYLVGGQVLRGQAANRFSWSFYMGSRLSRLWTVLLPALAVTAILNVFSHMHYPYLFSLVPEGSQPLTVSSAACNAVFLMYARCPSFGSNGPLWSLAFEFWFYVLFAAFAALWYTVRRGNYRQAITMLVVIVAGSVLFGKDVYLFVPAWLLGAAIAYFEPKIMQSREHGVMRFVMKHYLLSVFASLCILGLAMIVSNLMHAGYPPTLLLVGAAATPLIVILIANPTYFHGRSVARLAKLGTISYTLYAFHSPIVELIIAAGTGLWSDSALSRGIAVYAVSAVTVVLVVPLWWLFERNTPVVRKTLVKLFTPTTARHAALARR